MAETLSYESLQSDRPHPRPLVELILLALPTVAQSVSYTVMQFIDTLMLSRINTESFTAAANAGMFAFSVICFGFGILLCVNTLVSQSFGKREYAHCGRYLWQGVWVAVAYSLMVLPLFAVSDRVFPALGHTASLAALETSYFRIVLCTTVCKMIGTAVGQFLIGTNRPNSPMLAAIAGVSVNAVAAYGMVLGHFGLPRLGVVGAAWAQNMGVIVEMSVLIGFCFARHREKFGVLDWRPRVREAVTLIKIGAGSGLQIVADVLAWTLFLTLVMALLGESAMAANQLMFRYMIVSFMPAVGISQAVTALVGRYIGMKRVDVAMQRANLGFVVAAIYMLACGVVMITLRWQLVHVFTKDAEVARLGAILLIFAGIYQVFDAMYVVYNGALRGAGDTFIPALVTASLCWGISVSGGYVIAKHWPALGVAGPWTACTFYGIVLGVFMLLRFRRGGWQRIHLEQEGTAEGAPAGGTDVLVCHESVSAGHPRPAESIRIVSGEATNTAPPLADPMTGKNACPTGRR